MSIGPVLAPRPSIGGVIATPGAVAAAAPPPSLFVDAADFAALWIAGQEDYSDTGLTTKQLTDGGTVQGVKDLASGARHMTKHASVNAPTLTASLAALNNKPAWLFGNSGLIHLLGGTPLSGQTVFTHYLVLYFTNTATIGVPYAEWHTDALAFIRGEVNRAVAGRVSYAARGNGVTVSFNSSAGYGSTPLLVTFRRSATNAFSLRVNGTQILSSTLNPGTISATSTVSMGYSAQNGTPGTDRYAGYMAMVGVTLADDYATQEPLIAAEYGITLP